MKAKWLLFAFFYFHLFFRIGTFQRVTGEKIKKTGYLSTRVSGCGDSAHISFSRRWSSAGVDSANTDI
jgi:hypothetical protein